MKYKIQKQHFQALKTAALYKTVAFGYFQAANFVFPCIGNLG